MFRVFDKVRVRSNHWFKAHQAGEVQSLCSEHPGRYIVVFNKLQLDDEGSWVCLNDADLEKV